MIYGKEKLQEAMIESFSLEKGMRDFYRYAEVKAESDRAHETFLMLRDWEERHMGYIESLYIALMGDRELQSYEAFSKKVPANNIESGIPLKDAMKLFDESQLSDDVRIISFALEMEEKAYNFYRDLAESAEDSNARIVFEEMMKQEQKHIDGLKSLQRAIGY